MTGFIALIVIGMLLLMVLVVFVLHRKERRYRFKQKHHRSE